MTIRSCSRPMAIAFVLALGWAVDASAQVPAAGATTARPGVPSQTPGAPPRDPSAPSPPEKGTGVVRGRVVALDTGLPIPRAQVVLVVAGKRRAATTDAEGAFGFTGVPAGRCDLSASKPRYVGSMLGARRPGRPGKPLPLAEGQTVDGLVIALPPAGVITGRVVDEAGDPVIDVKVTAMRYHTIEGERRLTEVGRFRSTDDTGAFRLFGLTPGTYYLSAQPGDSHAFPMAEPDPDATGFAPTFYPGTAVAGEAQPIEVVAGADVVADLQLVTARLTTVTGIVVDQAGVPASGGYIMVNTRTGSGSHGSTGGEIKGDGTFTVTGITPGEHTLVARPRFGPAPMFETFGPNSEQRRMAHAPIVANGSPIAGLRLVVQDPVRIPVNVTFDDSAAPRPERITVSAFDGQGMGGGMALVRDGRLALEVIPGTYRVSAGMMVTRESGGERWSVKRIAYRGRDVEDEPVELTAEPGGRIDVVFTTRSSNVAGSVTDDADKPIAEYVVFILPEDAAALRRGTFPRVRFATPDPHGRFDVKQLRPGRYVAAALAEAPEDSYDLDFLESVHRIGKPFTLGEDGTATVTLKLSTLP